MKFYHFIDPYDYRYARAGRLGTWYPSPGPGVCPKCSRSRQTRVPPLVIEWLPGSDQVGDFTWPGSEVVVSERVRQEFESRFRAFEFHEVQMYQDPKLKRPQRVTKRTKPRVWLPYEGPPIWDLQPTVWCSLLIEQSGLKLLGVCPGCGVQLYERPPLETRFLIVDPTTWRGEDVFRIREYPGQIFCTETVKTLVEDRGFTNVGFRFDGEIPN